MQLADDMKQIINNNYKKSQNFSVKQRLQNISDGFITIIDVIRNTWQSEADEFYKERAKKDKQLADIQSTALKEIAKGLDTYKCDFTGEIIYELALASSFSARMNLPGESDIDLRILIKNCTTDALICISNVLGKCDYTMTDIRNKMDPNITHWVYNKYIDEVEIEIKVGDLDGYAEIRKIHTFNDNNMDMKTKILATYGKYLFKN